MTRNELLEKEQKAITELNLIREEIKNFDYNNGVFYANSNETLALSKKTEKYFEIREDYDKGIKLAEIGLNKKYLLELLEEFKSDKINLIIYKSEFKEYNILEINNKEIRGLIAPIVETKDD